MKEFSLVEFASLLGTLASTSEMANRHALDAAAVVVETEAKRVLGTYDYGWPQLAQSTQDQRVHQGYTPNDPGFRSGAMQQSIEHTTAKDETHIGTDDQHMVFFELGTKKQPPRPTLAVAALKKEAEVVDLIGRSTVAHLSGTALP